jgi:hypothetical protein
MVEFQQLLSIVFLQLLATGHRTMGQSIFKCLSQKVLKIFEQHPHSIHILLVL